MSTVPARVGSDRSPPEEIAVPMIWGLSKSAPTPPGREA